MSAELEARVAELEKKVAFLERIVVGPLYVKADGSRTTYYADPEHTQRVMSVETK
jgi:hypothetical protein